MSDTRKNEYDQEVPQSQGRRNRGARGGRAPPIICTNMHPPQKKKKEKKNLKKIKKIYVCPPNL